MTKDGIVAFLTVTLGLAVGIAIPIGMFTLGWWLLT